MRLGSRSRLVATIGLGLTLTAPAAHANIPLPSVFGFIAPMWMAWLTLGLSFAVVTVVEGAVLSRVLHVTLARGVHLAFMANLITTVIGALAGSVMILGWLLIAAIFPIRQSLRRDWGIGNRTAIPLSLFPLVGLCVWVFLTYHVAHLTPVIFGSLIPAFLVTTFIEVLIVRKMEDRNHIVKAVTVANLASYTLLALTLVVFRVRGEEVPLHTPDLYTAIIVPHMLQRGDIDEAAALMDRAVDLSRGIQPRRGLFFSHDNTPRSLSRTHYAFTELRFARQLLEMGRQQHAIRILESTLEIPNLSEADAQELRRVIAECREAMENEDLRDLRSEPPGD